MMEFYSNYELADADTEAAWHQYRRSGVPAMIDGFHTALVLNALMKAGVLARLNEGPVSEAELCEGLEPHITSHVMRWLAIKGFASVVDGRWTLTDQGRDATSPVSLAQIEFYVEAYGPVTTRMSELLTHQSRYGSDVLRDGAALGRSCATLFSTFHTSTVLEAMQGRDAKKILDVGCGAGAFLIDACLRDPEVTGIGLDISEGAIDEANKAAVSAGVADRLTFEVGDAFAPSRWPASYGDADVLTAVGVLHEHFREGEEAVLALLGAFSQWAGPDRAIVLGEPEIYYDDIENDADLFLVHILTFQGFPRRRSLWLELFERSTLSCRAVYSRRNAGPRFAFYELVARS